MICSQTDIAYNHRNLFQDVEIQWLTQIPGAQSDVECMNPLTFPVWYINIDGTVYDEMKTPLGFLIWTVQSIQPAQSRNSATWTQTAASMIGTTGLWDGLTPTG